MDMKLKTNYPLVLTLLLLFSGQLFQTALALGPDPSDPGPYAVTTTEYNFGDLAFAPSGFPSAVEVRSAVYHPTDLTDGPFPLVVFMHGRHGTCYLGSSAFLQWPCTGGRLPIPSFEGYDYIGQTLASHGYIVISVSANGINAFDNSVFDLGMIARGELIQHHLDLWQTFTTIGGAPFGTTFVGKVDMNNVGTMGHSRGGEGVVRHYVINQSLGAPYGIKAVLPLAPVDFNRPVINNVPLAVMLPYCDGDVSDLQGMHFFDDALYNVPDDPAAKHTILVMGANHNFFNKVWTPGLFPAGTIDDWVFTGAPSDPHCGPTPPTSGRLTATEQRAVGHAYHLAFFRTYLGGETAFQSLLAGDVPPPPSALTDQIRVTYHAPDNPLLRHDVNRLLDATSLVSNTLGGAVTQSGLTPYFMCGGPLPQPRHCLSGQSTSRQPHTTVSARASSLTGLPQLNMGWNSAAATYSNDLPPGTRDVSGFFALSFRASVNYNDVRNPTAIPQNFSVTVTDGIGNTSTARVGDWTGSLYYPPGSFSVVPKVVLNSVRVPLFAFNGVNKSDITSVRFNFDQMSTGALLISDIAFADGFAGSDNDDDGIPDVADNCPTDANPAQADGDTDGVGNACDNCLAVGNPVQRDTDGDGYGNYCDPDFDNNAVINVSDLFYMRSQFLSSDPDADLNGDGVVNTSDLFIMRAMFLDPPGPSCCAP